jgi:predicted signal transduction protein with EAL and GGDEF domain
MQPGQTMKKQDIDLPVEDPRRVDRVRERTPAHVLAKLDRRTAARVFRCAREGAASIQARIEELDREWDIERYLTVNFVVLSTIAEQKGRNGSRAWMALFRAQQAFLLMHATIGWCPPTAVFRRLGVRTQKEIDAERAVLTELYHLLREEPEPEIIAVTYDTTIDTSSGTPLRW